MLHTDYKKLLIVHPFPCDHTIGQCCSRSSLSSANFSKLSANIPASLRDAASNASLSSLQVLRLLVGHRLPALFFDGGSAPHAVGPL